MRRNIFSIGLSLIMLGTMMGCQNRLPQSDVSEQASSGGEGGFVVSEEMQNAGAGVSLMDDKEEEGFDTSGIDTSKHVVITYMTTGDKPKGKASTRLHETIAELNEILNEKVNAELTVEFVEWDNYLENYNAKLELLDGSVDLVGASTDWLDGWANVKKGMFLPLSESMIRK